MSTTAKVLELLRSNPGQWQPMESLTAALGERPETVCEQIERLRRMGHAIESSPVQGFHLCQTQANLSGELIECGLGTERIGRELLVYETTDSTNDIAWLYARQAGYDGLAVFSEQQRAGRGRLGREWLADKGSSILCSVLLQRAEAISSQALTLLAGLSTAEAIEKTCRIKAQIKWPNDVMLSGRKLAGVMIEARKVNGQQQYVVGIGINCLQQTEDFSAGLRQIAVSLRQVSGGPIDRLVLAQELLRQIEHWLGLAERGDDEALHDAWLRRCGDVGGRITLASNARTVSGRVVDVSCRQGLLVQLDGGAVQFFDAATTTVVKASDRNDL